MEESGAKFSRLIEYVEGIDYVKAARNLVIVFSFSTVHFFGFTFFAFGSVPPFVDFTSFSSVVFIALSYFAIASFLSQVIAMVATRHVIPYLIVLSRHGRHGRRPLPRPLRSESLGPRKTVSEEIRKLRDRRSIDQRVRLIIKVQQKSEMRYEVLIRYSSLVGVFALLYLGAKIAIICILATFIYYGFLYVAYYLVQYVVFQAAVTLIILMRFQDWSFADGSSRGSFKLRLRRSLSIVNDIISVDRANLLRHIKGFLSLHFALLLVILSLVFGIGRSAHVLGTESFDIDLMNGRSEEYLSTSIVLITSNGILGVSGVDEAMMFVPFDAGPVITPSETDKSDFYIRLLVNTFFDLERPLFSAQDRDTG
ncbi:hypothetical protein [Yoonia maritima]|uniref:hypothetical protein n=1 Tax=Yoonia maritima TaxID=1435347 RepID=UPI0037366FDC